MGRGFRYDPERAERWRRAGIPSHYSGESARAASQEAQPDTRNPDKAPFVVRAGMTGHLPGLWGSDHLNELRQYKNATYLAVHAASIQAAQSTITVKVRGPHSIRKGFSTAPDAADDEKTVAPRHPIAKLLRRPNPLTDGGVFLYQIAQQMRLTGGAVIWERRNDLGLPAELWVIPRGWLHFQRPTHKYPYGFWRVNPTYAGQWMSPWVGGAGFWGTTQWELDVRKTIRIGWPDPNNPGEFTSPLDACASIIDTSNQTEKAVWSQLARGIRPSVILSILSQANGMMLDPLNPEQIEQLRAQLLEFMGSDNDGKAIIGNNIGVERFDADLTKLNAVEARKQNYEFVFGVHGTPTAATGAITETSYAGIVAGVNGWVELNIQPNNDRIGHSLTHRWEGLYPGGPEVAVDAKRMDDPQLDQARVSLLLEARQMGVPVTDNQILVSLKLPKVPGGDEPPPKPQAVGPDGMPAPDPSMGVPGMAPDASGGDDFGTLDLDPELSGPETTGFKRPELSRAGGRAFSLNGTGGH